MTEICAVCGETFATPASLREHAWTTHRACHYCGEQFDDRETCYVHWLAVHDDTLTNRDRQHAEAVVGPLTVGDRLTHQGLSALTATRWPARAAGGVFGVVVLVAVLFVLGLTPNVLGGGSNSVPYHATGGSTGTQVGQQPPHASLQTINGSTVILPNGSRPTVVFYMAAWCPSCPPGEKRLRQIHQQYGTRVRIVTVDVSPQRDSPDDLRAFKQQYGGRWSHALATPAFIQSYRVNRLETTLVINRHGVVVYHGTDPSVDTLENTLAHLVRTNTTTDSRASVDHPRVMGR